METVAPPDLAAALASPSPPAVLDVRLADDFQAAHLPGAANNCVFEVAFHERLPAALPDKARPVVVYGACAGSAEAAMAAEKLERAGYGDVSILDGGLEAWRAAGHRVESGPPLPAPPPPPHGRRALDLAECRLEWLGRNLLNKHTGTVEITSGHLDFDRGRLTGGEITFDFRTLRCADLAGSELHDVLVRHLQDHDFLDAGVHPEGRLVIRRATQVDAPPGLPNLEVEADLTLRGQTHPVEFTAVAGLTPDGRPAAQAAFDIDRTRWGILYGSGKFFYRLAGHLVNDLVEFQVRVVAV
jgi:rhodanese-related sulfurtransferase/polyisoprenoid-binding protein YceI